MLTNMIQKCIYLSVYNSLFFMALWSLFQTVWTPVTRVPNQYKVSFTRFYLSCFLGRQSVWQANQESNSICRWPLHAEQINRRANCTTKGATRRIGTRKRLGIRRNGSMGTISVSIYWTIHFIILVIAINVATWSQTERATAVLADIAQSS